MPLEPAGTERLNAFSDGVIAVIITIMVLDLHAPHETDAASLVHLWPTLASYAISYLFVAIVWTNHHHMLRFAHHANAATIWANFFFLFFVSLIPFCTAYIAETRISPIATALYAANFLGVNISFQILERVIFRQHSITPAAGAAQGEHTAEGYTASNAHLAMVRVARKRSWTSFTVYAAAIALAWVHPSISLGLIVAVSLALYVLPDALFAHHTR